MGSHNDLNGFNLRFAALVEASGLSVRAVQRKTGVGHTTVADWRRGKALPQDSDQLIAVVRACVAAADERGAALTAADRDESGWRAAWTAARNARDARSDAPVSVAVELFLDTEYVQLESGEYVAMSGHGIRLIVESLVPRAVVLLRFRPVVISRESPIDGSHLRHLGAVEVRSFELHLDEADPALHPLDGGPDFPFTVKPDEPEVFDVNVYTKHYVHWRLELDWSSAGRPGTTLVDLAGSPFTAMPDPLS